MQFAEGVYRMTRYHWYIAPVDVVSVAAVETITGPSNVTVALSSVLASVFP